MNRQRGVYLATGFSALRTTQRYNRLVPKKCLGSSLWEIVNSSKAGELFLRKNLFKYYQEATGIGEWLHTDQIIINVTTIQSCYRAELP